MILKNEKYKIGIIGCGNIYPRHLEAVQTNSEYFEVAALCDIDEKKVKNRAAELNVPGFVHYGEMLEQMKSKMNMVVIATPNSFHFDQAMDSLKSGYDILIEKPIDFKSSRVAEIGALARSVNKNSFGVLQVRYNNTLKMLKMALEEGIIGDIRSVSLIQRWQRPEEYFDSWRADINVGGRTLYEVGIHYMDILQLFFGRPEVLASSTFSNKHKRVSFEDTVFALLKFPGGYSGSLEVTIASEPRNLECSISVMGSLGYIKIGGKALDEISDALFLNSVQAQKWEELLKQYDGSLLPNSYGTYSGSCPNHPTLYREIAEGRGIFTDESINVVKFIEDIYEKEVK